MKKILYSRSLKLNHTRWRNLTAQKLQTKIKITEMFRDYLYSVHQTPENPNFNYRFREKLDRHIQTNKQLYTSFTDTCINREVGDDSPDLDSFNKQEILKHLKTWKSHSAPGEDEISDIFPSKKCPRIIILG